MPPKTYKVQDGCWNCLHMLDASDQDAINLYCRFGCARVPKIPGSCHTFTQMTRSLSLWNKWANKHGVSTYGICDSYFKKENVQQHCFKGKYS